MEKSTKNVYIATSYSEIEGKIIWKKIPDESSMVVVEQYKIKTKNGNILILSEIPRIIICELCVVDSIETETEIEVKSNKEIEFKEKRISEIKEGDYVPITIEIKNDSIIEIESNVEFSKYLPIMNAGKFELSYMSGILVGKYINGKCIVKSSELRTFLTNFIKEIILPECSEIENSRRRWPECSEIEMLPKPFICGLLKGYFNNKGKIYENCITIDIISEKVGNSISMLCSLIGVLCYIKSDKLIIPKMWIKCFLNLIDNIDDKNEKRVFLDKIIEIEKCSADCCDRDCYLHLHLHP